MHPTPRPQPGDALPELRVRPGEVQLFRFSAVTWNAHRIHYDAAYAREEGYRAPLVHAQLHGSLLARVVTSWLGPNGRISRMDWRNRAPAYAGELLVARAWVAAVDADAAAMRVELQLQSENEAGTVLAQGSATALLAHAHGGTHDE